RTVAGRGGGGNGGARLLAAWADLPEAIKPWPRPPTTTPSCPPVPRSPPARPSLQMPWRRAAARARRSSTTCAGRGLTSGAATSSTPYWGGSKRRGRTGRAVHPRRGVSALAVPPRLLQQHCRLSLSLPLAVLPLSFRIAPATGSANIVRPVGLANSPWRQNRRSIHSPTLYRRRRERHEAGL